MGQSVEIAEQLAQQTAADFVLHRRGGHFNKLRGCGGDPAAAQRDQEQHHPAQLKSLEKVSGREFPSSELPASRRKYWPGSFKRGVHRQSQCGWISFANRLRQRDERSQRSFPAGFVARPGAHSNNSLRFRCARSCGWIMFRLGGVVIGVWRRHLRVDFPAPSVQPFAQSIHFFRHRRRQVFLFT